MNAVDYILDGLKAELELERELGVRLVECDRTILKGTRSTPLTKPASVTVPKEAAGYPYVFLHDQPLSERGNEMMAKIIAALGRTLAVTPIIVEPPLPPARVYVVLGRAALKRYFPGTKGVPGTEITTSAGQNLLITYSPDYILRFPEVTDAVKAMKVSLWSSLKNLNRRSSM